MSLPKLRELQSLAQEFTNYDYESAEYRVTAIILDTAQYRLFRPVRGDLLSTDTPCIMSAQYTRGCAVHRGVCSTPGDIQYTGGYHEYSGGYHEYTGGCSVHWGLS